jgi:hypothetical protein
MVLRENYFGAFTNISTAMEYQRNRDLGHAAGDPVNEKYRAGKVCLLFMPPKL